MTEEAPTELDGIGVIEIGEGELFDSQTGGYACHHPTVRGRKLPLAYDENYLRAVDDALCEWFYSGPHSGHCYSFNGEGNFNETDALVVEAMFGILLHGVIVDRSRLGECEEAWVYALWGGRRVLLYWTNSD